MSTFPSYWFYLVVPSVRKRVLLGICVKEVHLLGADQNHDDGSLSACPRPIRAIPPGVVMPETASLPIATLDDENENYGKEATIDSQQNLNSLLNEDTTIIPVLTFTGCLRPHTEGKTEIMGTTGEKQTTVAVVPVNQLPEKHDYYTVQTHSAIAAYYQIPPCKETSVQNARNRLRRARISEGLRSLKESCPVSGKGNQESAIDDIIDYIKLLKLQLRALSEARIGGEPEAEPLVHIEGFGHYLAHQQALGEPLEEVMEQLMELSMPAAVQFLEHKGLTILPMTLADTLFQTSCNT